MNEGVGSIKTDGVLYGEMESFKGPDGQTTRLVDPVLRQNPGSPTYVGKASADQVQLPEFPCYCAS